eukprot:12369996-Heterocapsa_arctica.AAC.1
MQKYRLKLDETGGADHQKSRWGRRSFTTWKRRIIDHDSGGGKRQKNLYLGISECVSNDNYGNDDQGGGFDDGKGEETM